MSASDIDLVNSGSITRDWVAAIDAKRLQTGKGRNERSSAAELRLY